MQKPKSNKITYLPYQIHTDLIMKCKIFFSFWRIKKHKAKPFIFKFSCRFQFFLAVSLPITIEKEKSSSSHTNIIIHGIVYLIVVQYDRDFIRLKSAIIIFSYAKRLLLFRVWNSVAVLIAPCETMQ